MYVIVERLDTILAVTLSERDLIMHPNVGKIFADTTIRPYDMYAVGHSGFLSLTTGTYYPYDDVIDGPEFFSESAFQEVALNA